MMRVLVDAELILSAVYENEHTPDAEILLTHIMPSEQIELYITELSLGKIRSLGKESAASFLEENFRIIKFNYCLWREQIFKSIGTRVSECALEVDIAIANNIRTVVTHKTEDFCSADLLVWTVNDLLEGLNDLPVLTETEIDFFKFKLELSYTIVDGRNQKPRGAMGLGGSGSDLIVHNFF